MIRTLFILLLSVYAYFVNAQCTFERYYTFYPITSAIFKTIKTSDGGFLTVMGGGFDSIFPGQDMDMLLVKNDSCGNTLWKTHYGYSGEGNDAIDAVEAANGDYLVTGNAGWQQATANIRVARFTKNGQFVWAKLYSGLIDSRVYSIIKRKNKNSYVVGGFMDDSHNGTDMKGYIIEINDNDCRFV